MKELLQGRWLKHPLHPILVHLPSALFPAAVLFDLWALMMGGNTDLLARISYYMVLAGLLGTLLAVPTGIADWSDVKTSNPAWMIGLIHMILNLVVAILFVVSVFLRSGLSLTTFSVAAVINAAPRVDLTIILLGAIASLILLVSGYLGHRMVYAYGISVARMSKERWRDLAVKGGARVPSK